jgi:hypothetical protein
MFAQMGSELGARILCSAVRVEYRTRSELDVGRGHGDRVTDQVGGAYGRLMNLPPRERFSLLGLLSDGSNTPEGWSEVKGVAVGVTLTYT